MTKRYGTATIARMSVDEQATPLAVSRARPHFSWAFRNEERDSRQEWFRIRVVRRVPGGDDVEMWDSGRRHSDQQLAIPYDGAALPTASAFEWTLWAGLTRGRLVERRSTFETGPEPADWTHAAWITAPRAHALHEDRRPSPVLRHSFPVMAGLRRARWYATAGGLFQPWLNGHRLSESDFAPGWTDYAHRVPFHSYDLTEHLTPGENVIGAVLADGWYSGFIGPFWKRDVWGPAPVLRGLVLLEYEDGRTEWIATDTRWRAAFGAIQASDLLHGEVYDRRKELGGWSDSSTSDGPPWRDAVSAAGPEGVLVPAMVAAPSAVQELAPIAVTASEPGSVIVDFGQNLAGRVRLPLDGSAGTVVRIRHSEILDVDGQLYVDNLRSARATDTVILDGSGPFVYEPTFTYHGFRYAEITAPEGSVDPLGARAIALSSVPEIAGTFSTDIPLVNRLQQNIVWSMLSNTFEVPTDCPQRDERLGWAGDAQVFASTAMFNGALAPFYRKWMCDIADAQKPDGAFADIAPGKVLDFAESGAAGYADAGVSIPWNSYEAYGDAGILEDAIDGMLAWLDYIRRANPDLIWRDQRNSDYGDWLTTDDTDKILVATAHFARAAQIAAKSAAVVGREDDARYCADLHSRIAAAYRAEFGDRIDPSVRTQTAAVFELEFNLVAPGARESHLQELVRRVEAAGHVTVGFLAIRYLLPLLTEAGRGDLAIDLLLREEPPSWGAQIARGLTTIGEHWSAWDADGKLLDPWMNSFNHVPLGAVGEWMYRSLGGLAASEPGYRSIRVAPIWDDPRVAGAECWHDSPYGPILVKWNRGPSNWTLLLDVPPGTTTEIAFPAGAVSESGVTLNPGAKRSASGSVLTVGSGRYSFTIDNTEETL